jgi:uncharacterized protein YyaL (SSP411 family)
MILPLVPPVEGERKPKTVSEQKAKSIMDEAVKKVVETYGLYPVQDCEGQFVFTHCDKDLVEKLRKQREEHERWIREVPKMLRKFMDERKTSAAK